MRLGGQWFVLICVHEKITGSFEAVSQLPYKLLECVRLSRIQGCSSIPPQNSVFMSGPALSQIHQVSIAAFGNASLIAYLGGSREHIFHVSALQIGLR